MTCWGSIRDTIPPRADLWAGAEAEDVEAGVGIDAGRLRTVADWVSHTTTYGYDENSNLTTGTYPNGVIATNAFDKANRLTSI